jgi:hypothetical protein
MSNCVLITCTKENYDVYVIFNWYLAIWWIPQSMSFPDVHKESSLRYSRVWHIWVHNCYWAHWRKRGDHLSKHPPDGCCKHDLVNTYNICLTVTFTYMPKSNISPGWSLRGLKRKEESNLELQTALYSVLVFNDSCKNYQQNISMLFLQSINQQLAYSFVNCYELVQSHFSYL